ncbi:CBS domain-containing protein [Desulfogranum mediterraneum]|uniref:CBS domain-containing protein n=1 Tax=Desulfogranum mediterraneum TaxID=160661 RepID=UPI000411227D|nr:CBS domain-containing protein [Desulfogranum mediterraneum]
MNAGEICNREVVVVNREQTILEAAKLMQQYHVGDLVVVEEGSGERVPVGILTDRDIVLKILARDFDPAEVKIVETMSFDLLTALEGDELSATVKRMRGRGVRRIPVVNPQGGLEGIIAVDDLVDLLAEQLTDLVALISREQRLEEQHRS